MAIIKEFKGVRYNSDKAGELADLITPPYDVINTHAEEAFRLRSPYNIIRLDITKEPGLGDNRDPDRYRDVASLLSTWLRQGVLRQDAAGSLYPYDVTYQVPEGRRLTRKGFVCLVKLAEFHEAVVKPHENIYPTIIQDRLELTRFSQAQFSQVFSCFSDPENLVVKKLTATREKPISSVTDADGNLHELWQVSDTQVIEFVKRFFVDRSLYIADGHHRYGTALAYRNELVAEDQGFDSDDPKNYIMMYLCPMEDEGLSILPAHRLVRVPGQLSLRSLLNKLDGLFVVEEVFGGNRETLLAEVRSLMHDLPAASSAAACFGLYHAGEDRGFLLSLKAEGAAELKTHHLSLRELDVVILSELIIRQTLGLDQQQCERYNLITYHSDMANALDLCVKESTLQEENVPLLFLVNPPGIDQVQRVADAGLIMPHKATYFYPKIVSGFVMHVFGGAGA